MSDCLMACCVLTDRGVTDPVDDSDDVNGAAEVHTKLQRQGTWADSETEKALRSIANFAKNYLGISLYHVAFNK